MGEYLPSSYVEFGKRYPKVKDGHDALAAACHDAGPIGGKERHLVKLGISIGAGHEGAVRSHVRQALEAGATREEIEHVALLAASTTGFPNTVMALSWIDAVIEARGGK